MITGIVTVLLWKQFFDPSKYGTLNSIMLNIPAIGFISIALALLVLFWEDILELLDENNQNEVSSYLKDALNVINKKHK